MSDIRGLAGKQSSPRLPSNKEETMPHRTAIGAAAVAVALAMAVASAPALAQSKYPDFSGQWTRLAKVRVTGQPSFDQTKPWGSGQQAPLTPEYQAILDANLKDQQNGGHGNFTGWTCLPYGMPMMMYAFWPIEFVVTPQTTYVLIDHQDAIRRIYTDGRAMPPNAEPAFAGYSIGHWIDEKGDGNYSALEVETRNFKGPRFFDESGIPMHADNESVFKERIYLDKSDPDVMHDEITVTDHALTRPWTVMRDYSRVKEQQPVWLEFACSENNPHVRIGGDNFYLSAEGLLMPARKDQAPPDLRYFKKTQN
jgi:hypothetical protein